MSFWAPVLEIPEYNNSCVKKDDATLIREYSQSNNTFSVYLLRENGKMEPLYEYIEEIQEAYMLAQYAMNHDRKPGFDGLIIIMPGWNRGIEREETYYQVAQRLALKYKADE